MDLISVFSVAVLIWWGLRHDRLERARDHPVHITTRVNATMYQDFWVTNQEYVWMRGTNSIFWRGDYMCGGVGVGDVKVTTNRW